MMHHESNRQSTGFQAMPGLENGLAVNTLESVHVVGWLRDLVCELTVTQSFVNLADTNIEAVYSFPLPHEAVLLELVANLGDRELHGKVRPKKSAEIRYEQAILAGDRAVLLEEADDGIFTVNLGNLMPGERAALRYQYAYLLSWRQDSIKFRLPTTMALRYGDPGAAGYQPHQIPVASLMADNRFTLELTVEGLLSTAQLDCPSHAINIVRQAETAEISLSEQCAAMDRDFVLNLKLPSAKKSAGLLQWDGKAQQNTAFVSFCAEIPTADIPCLCLKIVVDCSASMSGIALRQAQIGLLQVLDNLRDSDSFNLLCFGAEHQAIFPSCVAVTQRSLRYARQAILNLTAEMGGTEIGAALDYTYKLSDTGVRAMAVLLITDGQTYQHREVILAALNSGHRIFTVGVGTAAAHCFINDIAEKTGGACEMVMPLEPMSEAIRRQFRRMLQARSVQAKLVWPEAALWQAPQNLAPLFSGDTLHVFAGFGAQVTGGVELIMLLDDGRQIRQRIELINADERLLSLPRIAAVKRIKDAPVKFAARLAKDYRLLSQYTHFLIVDKRKEVDKAQQPPKLVQTPQLLAAGWGGACAWESEAHNSPRSVAALSYLNPVFISAFNDFDPLESEEFYRLPVIELLSPLVCGPDTNKRAILLRVTKAEGQWLTEFLTKILTCLNPALQEIFQELLSFGGWNTKEAAAAILFVLTKELGVTVENTMLEREFKMLAEFEVLLEFIQSILKEDTEADLRRITMSLPCKDQAQQTI